MGSVRVLYTHRFLRDLRLDHFPGIWILKGDESDLKHRLAANQHSQAPKNMRSLVAAFALFMNAISSALQEAWLPLLVDPDITWNYASVAIIAFVFGVAFYLFNRGLDRAEDQLNQLKTGTVNSGVDVEQHRLVESSSNDEKKGF